MKAERLRTFLSIKEWPCDQTGFVYGKFPLPPHLTCAVIKAASLDCENLLLVAAMLSVENVFIRPGKEIH